MEKALLKVENLKTYFFLNRGIVKAVDGVSFSVNEGQSVGLVGESGCGKTITARSILRLEPRPYAKIVGGKILFKDEDLVQKNEKQMRKIRGTQISMIMQEPMASLNPVYTIRNQIEESLKLHTRITSRQVLLNSAAEALKRVNIPDPLTLINDYPHQMSGGMKQRVVGAIAISCHPSLLIADEPTTALDLTTQAQYLKLLQKIQQETGVSIIFITHDLGIVVRMCEVVCIMYMGKVVESGKVKGVWDNPIHPYTEALIKSIPDMHKKTEKLYSVKGSIPSPLNIPSGCAFHPRCEHITDRCSQEYPPEVQISPDHYVSCWRV
jgi:oligopeptide/dipeptide ABC transporter ATP-binding protein